MIAHGVSACEAPFLGWLAAVDDLSARLLLGTKIIISAPHDYGTGLGDAGGGPAAEAR